MSETTKTVESVVHEYANLWNEQDYDRIPSVVSGSYCHRGPQADVDGPSGLETLMREFTSAFPDFHVEVVDVISDEDGETAVAEGQYTMTHTGEFNGIPPTNREAEVSALAKLRIEDGKVVEHREFHDRMALLEQLGITDQ
jgi:steroid delta-isomerase-like uncharacterized protein